MQYVPIKNIHVCENNKRTLHGLRLNLKKKKCQQT